MTAPAGRIPAIVQARMGSSRLPGKMLRLVHGKPVLEYVLERLGQSPVVGPIVVATSADAADAAIAEFCTGRGIRCTRGPLDDVARRFRETVEALGVDRFFRVCGDRPLIDSTLFERAVSLAGPGVDLVTNAHPRTFPAGQTVELVATAAFIDACNRLHEAEDREHVTRYFYHHADDYRIVNFTASRSFGSMHLALDTEADLQRFAEVIGRMQRPHWSYGLDEIVTLYQGAA